MSLLVTIWKYWSRSRIMCIDDHHRRSLEMYLCICKYTFAYLHSNVCPTIRLDPLIRALPSTWAPLDGLVGRGWHRAPNFWASRTRTSAAWAFLGRRIVQNWFEARITATAALKWLVNKLWKLVTVKVYLLGLISEKSETICSQTRLSFSREFHGTAALFGCKDYFLYGHENGGGSEFKKRLLLI